MANVVNYPDVLGYISGGARMDYGVVQAAVAVQPNPSKAGRPVDITLILQNMTDSALEVIVALTVPANDLRGKASAFVAKSQRLAVGMQPAEVGVLVLPVAVQPLTAPGEYKFSLQIAGKVQGKGGRIRLAEGGGVFYMGAMTYSAQQAIESLKALQYTAAATKRGGLFGGAVHLEATLMLEEGSLGTVLDRKADYRPLWSQSDRMDDPLLLLEKHKTALVDFVLPTLDRARLHEALMYRSIDRFKEAGYNLKDIEANLIASVMMRVLEYACTEKPTFGHTFEPRPEYEVLRLINMPAQNRPKITLRWLIMLLSVIEQDPRNARFSSKFLPERCYDGLLNDALEFALHEFEPLTGIELGSANLLEQFAHDWAEKFGSGKGLTFTDIYLPLVIIGIALHDQQAMIPENIKIVHTQMQRILEGRKNERTDQNGEIFDIARDMLEMALAKFGVPML